MRSHPVRRSPALWLALFAALLNALSPLAAYARSSTLALPMELCSTAAPDSAIDIPVPGMPAGHVTHLPHCAFCPAAGLSLPGLPAGGLAAAALAAVAAAYFPHAGPPAQDSSYLPSRPRGPPAPRT
jgi:hypothetical protein